MPEVHAEDHPLDLMYKKGKGNGKGKRGPPQGGKGDQSRWTRDQGKGKGQGQKPTCEFCLNKGHEEKDCRKKAAGQTRSDQTSESSALTRARPDSA